MPIITVPTYEKEQKFDLKTDPSCNGKEKEKYLKLSKRDEGTELSKIASFLFLKIFTTVLSQLNSRCKEKSSLCFSLPHSYRRTGFQNKKDTRITNHYFLKKKID